MKQVIRLTESGIHGIVKQIINEIGYRAATLATGANMKAADFGQVNKQVADSLILHMTNCMYSIEDYQSSI